MNNRCLEIKKLIDPIQGWINPKSGAGLYKLVKHYAKTPIVVELGSWKGKSTAWLAFGIKDRGEGIVYAVDHWKGSNEEAHKRFLKNYREDDLYNEFIGNMKSLKVLDVIQPIRENTLKAVNEFNIDKKIGVLHIDASHEYKNVRMDFEYWSPFVEDGGFIVFDDVPSWPGPTRLVSELPGWYKQVAILPNKWIVMKTGETFKKLSLE